jgi:hypothetical protein
LCFAALGVVIFSFPTIRWREYGRRRPKLCFMYCIIFANLAVSTWIVATTPLIAAHEDGKIKEHSVPLQGTVDGHLDVSCLPKCFKDDVDVDDTGPHGLLFPHHDYGSTVQVAGLHVVHIFVVVVIMSWKAPDYSHRVTTVQSFSHSAVEAIKLLGRNLDLNDYFTRSFRRAFHFEIRIVMQINKVCKTNHESRQQINVTIFGMAIKSWA